MRTFIHNGKILTPETLLQGKTLILEDQKVRAIEAGPPSPSDGDLVIDARGGWVAPGLIDIHVHGAVGHDASDATPEALAQMGRFMARHGVASYLPTTLSVDQEAIYAAIENVASCPQPPDGARHLGVHIEGPYFNPDYRGAQPERYLRDADPSEYEAWLRSGVVRLITVAPERPGVPELIRRGVSCGVEFAAGHTGASYEQVVQAADLGLRQATHTFNGMLGLHHRRPGTAGAVLTDDRIYAQVIADGVHVHPAMVDLLARAKGVERTILITDAIRAVGLEDGEYTLGGDTIIVKDGVSCTLDGGLAGSTLTMDAAIRNMMAFTGLSFAQVVPMATSTPAEAMGWTGKKGRLTPGADADVTLFDDRLEVCMTIVMGRVVYQR